MTTSLPGLSPALVARLSKNSQQHKYDHGHALICSGGVGRGGAARLAGRGALRIGAGLVTIACPPAALIENAAQLTAIMLRSVADAEALAEMLADTRFNALCLGPGQGLSDRTKQMVGRALAADRATVLDADALTVFESDPDALFAQLHPRTVITPHMGEFSRLFPDEAEQIRGAKSELVIRQALNKAARRAHCVVLLKGPTTRIADLAGHVYEIKATGQNAAPWLATAGSGDVLAGFITGLLARGFSPSEAAQLGTGLHIAAARSFGPGLIAEDLPEALPKIFQTLAI
ncbi:MAG: NAD(P)H-hydrate dehydratase [Mangrovicoccus sp.]